MSTRTPDAQPRNKFHRDWGNYATAADLPNVAASATQSAKVEVGDTAYVIGTSARYVCQVATLGAAVWNQQGNLGPIVLVTPTSETAFATIAAALAAAAAGDSVRLWPGTYAESVTLPAGVTLQGAYGTPTISGAAATGTRVVMGVGSFLQDLRVDLPTDATPAVDSSVAGATLRDVSFMGQGGVGVGVRVTAGILFLDGVDYLGGVAASFIQITGGLAQANEVFVFGGTLADVVLVAAGTFDFVNLSVADTAVITDGIEVGAGAVHGQVGRMFAVNALHVTSDSADIELESGFDLNGSVADILGQPGVTSARLILSLGQLSTDRIDVDGAWRASDGWQISYIDTKEGDPALRIESELAVGTAERGRESVFGEGDSYTQGMIVITTDATAGAVSDGGNLTDVSVAARSATTSTFTFQGLAANHTILFGSSRSDGVSVLKLWGLKIQQTIAAVELQAKSFVYEIWDGAAWVSVGVMATHSSLFYRYGNELFIRTGTSEHHRFGITPDTTWATKAISGSTLFWARIRIVNTLTTLPVFEQFKLSTSRAEINGDGTQTFHGQARFRQTLVSMGNVYGESGGVAGFTLTVGSGGIPTGWGQSVKNSNLNGNGDAIYTQFALPRGLDTSHPIELNAYWIPTLAGAADVQMIMSGLPLESQGVMVADPTGGTVPVPRTLANTETRTANPGTAVTASGLDATDTTKIRRTVYEPYPVVDHYEGDMCLLRLELDNDGVGNANIGVLSIEISGVSWTLGERL